MRSLVARPAMAGRDRTANRTPATKGNQRSEGLAFFCLDTDVLMVNSPIGGLISITGQAGIDPLLDPGTPLGDVVWWCGGIGATGGIATVADGPEHQLVFAHVLQGRVAADRLRGQGAELGIGLVAEVEGDGRGLPVRCD